MKKFSQSKKSFSKIRLLVLSFVIIYAASTILLPHTAHAQTAAVGKFVLSTLTNVIGTIVSPVAYAMFSICTLFTYLAGMILNQVVDVTVVHMAKYITDIGIGNVWATVRDVGNIGFIFILLYASIQMILGVGKNPRELIVNMIVVAILINFSLFFTKLVIDAANILAVTFYDAMAPGELNNDVTKGLATAMMSPLKLQTIFDAAHLHGNKILIMSIMGSILALVAAFVFFAAALLLIIRFIVLVLVMALSPIAFIAMILPQMDKYAKQWREALIGQAFFAPIYFMMTWIVIAITHRLPSPEGASLATAFIGKVGEKGESLLEPNSIALLINYIMVIGFLIASLIAAKEWANKAGGGISKLTNWATGVAGGATFGMAGRLGRNTFGRVATAVGGSEALKGMVLKGGAGGMAARLALAAGKKVAKQSFDVRGSALGGTLDGGKAAKGGFAQTLKDKRKAEKEFADSLAPSDTLVTQAERRKERAALAEKDALSRFGRGSAEHQAAADEKAAAAEAVDRLKGVDDKEAVKRIKRDNALTDTQAREMLSRDAALDPDQRRYAGLSEEDALRKIKKDNAMSDDDAKEILERDKELPNEQRQYGIESLADTRKKQRVESLERSPTFVAANLMEEGGRRVAATGTAQAINRGAQGLAGGIEEVARKINAAAAGRPGRGGAVVGAVGRAAAGAVRTPTRIVRAVADGVREIPELVRIKNQNAIAEVRKGKKPVKDIVEELMRDAGDLPAADATPPAGGGGGGGGGGGPAGTP